MSDKKIEFFEYDKLRTRMQLLGYTFDAKGMCHGISLMYGIAGLLGIVELEKFNKTIARFCNMSDEEFEKIVAENEKLACKLTKATETIQEKWKKEDEYKKTHVIQRQARYKIFHDHQAIELATIKSTLLEFKAFREGVMMLQNSHLAPRGFFDLKKVKPNQVNLSQVLSLLEPEKLADLGGIKEAGFFTGIYQLRDVELYVESLHAALVAAKFPGRLFINVCYANHSTLIIYDAERASDKPWFYVNPAWLPPYAMSSETLVHGIYHLPVADHPSSRKHRIFATKLYTTGSFFSALTQAIPHLPPTLAEFKPTTAVCWSGIENYLNFLHGSPLDAKIANIRNELGISWLWIAAHSGDLLAVQQLLKVKGIDIENSLEREAGENEIALNIGPLYIAACGGHFEIVKALLNAGADCNKLTKLGTPLHGAVIGGHPEIVLALLENEKKPADPNLRDGNGQTPYDIAIATNKLELVAMLVNHGAEISKQTFRERKALPEQSASEIEMTTLSPLKPE